MHPHDHPIWQDINFTPEWLWTAIKHRGEYGGQQGCTARVQTVEGASSFRHPLTSAPNTALTDNGAPWMAEEDTLIHYQHSPLGSADGFTAADVAQLLGRTVNGVKSRWHRELKGIAESLPPQNLAQLVARGKQLALQKGQSRQAAQSVGRPAVQLVPAPPPLQPVYTASGASAASLPPASSAAQTAPEASTTARPFPAASTLVFENSSAQLQIKVPAATSQQPSLLSLAAAAAARQNATSSQQSVAFFGQHLRSSTPGASAGAAASHQLQALSPGGFLVGAPPSEALHPEAYQPDLPLQQQRRASPSGDLLSGTQGLARSRGSPEGFAPQLGAFPGSSGAEPAEHMPQALQQRHPGIFAQLPSVHHTGLGPQQAQQQPYAQLARQYDALQATFNRGSLQSAAMSLERGSFGERQSPQSSLWGRPRPLPQIDADQQQSLREMLLQQRYHSAFSRPEPFQPAQQITAAAGGPIRRRAGAGRLFAVSPPGYPPPDPLLMAGMAANGESWANEDGCHWWRCPGSRKRGFCGVYIYGTPAKVKGSVTPYRQHAGPWRNLGTDRCNSAARQGNCPCLVGRTPEDSGRFICTCKFGDEFPDPAPKAPTPAPEAEPEEAGAGGEAEPAEEP
ncbi:hypothetical protein WJX72_001407 [[Myrmecia] bisecta]|uniref:Myb-like domain-containing protein n=1 Tax=[Myrmecia] bisecta TaxID=41462 RepID=A0AAW1Q0D8_9CHLO